MTEIWEEPPRGTFVPPELYSLPGLDRLRLMRQKDRYRTPFNHLLGVGMPQVGPGTITFTAPVTAWLAASAGWIDPTFLADAAMYYAVESVLPAAVVARGAQVSINYLRSVTLDAGTLTARGRTVYVGRMFAFAQAEVEDGNGRLVAHAVGRYRQVVVEPPPPPMPAELPSAPEERYDTPDPYLRVPIGRVARPEEWGKWAGVDAIRERMGVGFIPMGKLLGTRLVAVEEGRCSAKLPATGWLLNANRLVVGGLVAQLPHAAMFSACRTLASPGDYDRTADLRIDFFREVQADGRDLTAVATVLHKDDEGAMASSELFDADGNLVALAGLRLVRIPAGSVVAGGGGDDLERTLATVLFTDIVDSTRHASQLGDRDWKELLERHHVAVREALKRFRGTEVNTVGDGFVATFESPARAVKCARAIRETVARFGVEIRAGLHTAEVEVTEDDIQGIAVHIAARVLGEAAAGEILVSSTVRDLVAGSDLEFSDRGVHELKGVNGEWRLYAVQG